MRNFDLVMLRIVDAMWIYVQKQTAYCQIGAIWIFKMVPLSSYESKTRSIKNFHIVTNAFSKTHRLCGWKTHIVFFVYLECVTTVFVWFFWIFLFVDFCENKWKKWYIVTGLWCDYTHYWSKLLDYNKKRCFAFALGRYMMLNRSRSNSKFWRLGFGVF